MIIMKEKYYSQFTIRLNKEHTEYLEELTKLTNIPRATLVRLMVQYAKKTGFTVNIQGEE